VPRAAIILLALAATPTPKHLIDHVAALDPSAHSAKTWPTPTSVLAGDRYVYATEDAVGQFFASFAEPARGEVRIAVHAEGGGTLEEVRHPGEGRAQFSFRVNVARLPAGRYVASIAVEGSAKGSTLEFAFSRSDRPSDAARDRFPKDGLPIALTSIPLGPVRAGIPIPNGAIEDAARLELLEDGVAIPADIHTRATWCPDCGPKWIHVDFVPSPPGRAPRSYRLVERTKPRSAATKRIAVERSTDRITVNTGAIRFEVSTRAFSGIDRAWRDPSGRAQYDGAHPVANGSGGAYLVDERGLRFDAKADDHASVEIERDESGDARTTILATGWYVNAEHRVEPLAMFRTRLTAWAGLPIVEIRHETILTYDTRLHRLADAGFDLGLVPDLSAMSWKTGLDGRVESGALPPSPGSVWFHQDRADRVRIGGMPEVRWGKKSDGWFRIEGAQRRGGVTIFLRDAWQKFPKEVELSSASMTVHAWPRHGHRAFSAEEELDLRNIYKFWCFHQHRLLDLNLPADYDERLLAAPPEEIFETLPEYARAANGQGLAIDTAFRVRFDAADEPTDVARWAADFQQPPSAHASPEWNARSGALGPLAASSGAFSRIEAALHDGFLSWTRTTERAGDYGMWIYGDTHTYWKVKEARPSLHRVWHASHYHEISTAWLMYFRTGAADLLPWARAATDHFMNVDTVNYADPKAPLKFHQEGAMYHCKGLVPWGAEAYGMPRRDTHSAVWGHFIDPDAFLWAWYMDGDPRAKDAYDLWSRAVAREGTPNRGTRREANTSLAYAVTYYEATWDPWILPSILGLGTSLRTVEPLESQAPGPLWHPLWINRYYERTRDPEYRPFIEKYARMSRLGEAWPIALAALAYRITNDERYLLAQGGEARTLVRRIFRAANDPYDGWGMAPSTLSDGYAYPCWGYFRAALERAGIVDFDQLPPAATSAHLPIAPSGTEDTAPPGLVVIAHEPRDRSFNVTIHARSLGADMHNFSLRVLSPSGRVLYREEVPSSSRGYDAVIPILEDDEAGADRIEIRGQELALDGPLTDLSDEAADLPKGTAVRSNRLTGKLSPEASAVARVTLTVASDSDDLPASYRIADARGRTIAEGNLFRPSLAARTVEIDTARYPAPWKIDLYGTFALRWDGDAKKLWFEPDPVPVTSGSTQPRSQRRHRRRQRRRCGRHCPR
jgi:hypothetical protein